MKKVNQINKKLSEISDYDKSNYFRGLDESLGYFLENNDPVEKNIDVSIEEYKEVIEKIVSDWFYHNMIIT